MAQRNKPMPVPSGVAQYQAATRRGNLQHENQLRAVQVRYDAKSERVVVRFNTGAEASFPAREMQGLVDATPKQLNNVQISVGGFGLYWPNLDVDFSIAGLMRAEYGSSVFMAEHRQPKKKSKRSIKIKRKRTTKREPRAGALLKRA